MLPQMFMNESDKGYLKDSFSMWCHTSNFDNILAKAENYSSYDQKLSQIATFNDKKAFWNVFQHLAKPSDLPAGVEYHIFKKDIKPSWEDEKNINGGKLSFLVNKGYSSLIWEEMVISFIGSVIPDYDLINGICISVKKTYDVAQIWFNSYDREKIHKLRNEIKTFFMIPAMVNMKIKTFQKLTPGEISHDFKSFENKAISFERKGKGKNSAKIEHH